MTLQSIELYGFKLPPGEFTIVTGDRSLEIFNEFISGRFVWAFSGIDWTKSKYRQRWEINREKTLISCLTEIRGKYGLSGTYYLWFEHNNAVLIAGDIDILCNMVSYFDEHPMISATDFWIFSKDTGECIEVYHEDVITLGFS